MAFRVMFAVAIAATVVAYSPDHLALTAYPTTRTADLVPTCFVSNAALVTAQLVASPLTTPVSVQALTVAAGVPACSVSIAVTLAVMALGVMLAVALGATGVV